MESHSNIIEYEMKKIYCQNCAKHTLVNLADISKTCTNCGLPVDLNAMEIENSSLPQQVSEVEVPENIRVHQFSMKKFYCHTCQHENLINLADAKKICPQCGSEFVEEIKSREFHPRQFHVQEKPGSAPGRQRQQHQRSRPMWLHLQTNVQGQQIPQVIIQEPPLPSPFVDGRSFLFQSVFGDIPAFQGFTQFTSRQNRLFDLLLPSFPSARIIFNQEGFNFNNNFADIIQHMMQQEQDRQGPPPASQQNLEKLQKCQASELKVKELCSVCQEQITEGEVVILPCNHAFHSDCIMPWFNIHNTCPNCRRQI